MMKRFLLIFATAFCPTLVLAGNPTPNLPKGSDPETETLFTSQRILKSVPGELSTELISDVDTGNLWTEVTITFPLECNQKFEKFSYLPKETSDGRMIIITSAFISEGPKLKDLDCPNEHKEIIIFDGDVTDIKQSPIYTHPFREGSFAIPPGTEALMSFNDATVTGVSPLCPKAEGVRCITDGTVISLTTNMICVNSIAGITYTTEQIGDEIHINLFGAEYQNKFHDKVKCREMPVKFNVTAIMAFTETIEKVKIHLVP